METDEDDPADNFVPDHIEPSSLRRFEALQAVARGEVTPPQGQPRPTVAGIFKGWWYTRQTSPGLAPAMISTAGRTEVLMVLLEAPPQGSGRFGGDVLWLRCEVLERLPDERLRIRLAPDARSENGEKDFVVRATDVFE